MGDFDGSGHQGLAIACQNGWIDVFTGQGNGQFTLSDSWNMTASLLQTPQYNTAQANALQVLAADFNNDGIPDLAVIGSVNEQFIVLDTTIVSGHYGAAVVFQGNGDGTFSIPPSTSRNVVGLPGGNPWMASVGDFNGDGNTDIAIPDRTANSIEILLGVGTGAFNPNITTLTPSALNAPDFVAAGDFNGDGIPDLAVANSGSAGSSLLVMLGAEGNLKGNANISFAAPVAFATGSGASGLAVGDVNGDGFPDIVVTNFNSSTVSVMLNDASAPGTNFTQLAGTFPNTLDPAFAVFADFNGDGRPDLAVTNDSPAQGSVGIGLGVFPTITGVRINNTNTNSVVTGTQPLTVELDGADIAIGSTVIWQILNNPTATLTPTVDPSGTFLTVGVPLAQVTAQGSGTITIIDPTGVSSNAFPFSVAPLTPTLTGLSVMSAPAGTNQLFSVTITGTGFASGDKAMWLPSVCQTSPCNIEALQNSTVNGPTQLSFNIPPNYLAGPDPSVTISVEDSFQHFSTNTLSFQVVSPAITSISSNSVNLTSVGVDSGNIALTVTGTNFVAGGSVVIWTNPCGGTAVNLGGIVSATAPQVTANLPANRIGSAIATACVTVENDAQAISAPMQILIGSPVIASMNPPSASVGGNLSINATITGANFVAGSQAFWCNSCTPPAPSSTPPSCSGSSNVPLCALPTTAVSSTQLNVTIPGGANGLLQSVGRLASS